MSELKLEELWLWCETCKKTFKAYTIKISDEKWIMINPHEHYLRVGICPRTVWRVNDYKEEKHPELGELFRLLEKRENLKKLLNLLEQSERGR